MIRRLIKFLRDRLGAVVVETALAFPFLVLMVIMIVDFGNVMLYQSKLERANASISSILRERNTFYEGEEDLSADLVKTQLDVDQLTLLARRIMGKEEVALIVEATYFRNDGTESSPVRAIDKHVTFTSSFNNYRCVNKPAPIENYFALSPLSEFRKGKSEPYMPLYRVTSCIPTDNSWFKKAFKDIMHKELEVIIAEELSASNIVIPR